MKSIEDNVTEQQLMECIDEIKTNWKAREEDASKESEKRKREDDAVLDTSFKDAESSVDSLHPKKKHENEIGKK
jgi:hypothetical protein